jgi:hypothetical protein
MKKQTILSLVILIISFNVNAQKIALLSKDLKSPILFTDSVTVEQITSGFFHIEVKNIDTFYSSLSFISEMLKKRQRSKMESFSFVSGSTTINIKRVPFAYGDRYQVIASSKVGKIDANKIFIDALKRNNNQSIEDIEKLKKYIASNKDLFKNPNEITPVISNIVTISEH